MRLWQTIVVAIVLAVPAACVSTDASLDGTRADTLPAMRWDHLPQAPKWTGAVLNAISEDGARLSDLVPSDIDQFCPAYETASVPQRDAFWAGLLSALAKHESTWNPKASGGGGRWIGLLQIAPATAQNYGCDEATRSGLSDGAANLACAVRIAAHQVARDGAIYSDESGDGWRGIARDWAPMRSAKKRQDMAAWTRQQS